MRLGVSGHKEALHRFCQTQRFRIANTTIAVQVARMGEFHACGSIISNKIRVIRPFVTFVFQISPSKSYKEVMKQWRSKK